jgi:TRAP-type C4-dicarboxylate transport system substrate-binding protein
MRRSLKIVLCAVLLFVLCGGAAQAADSFKFSFTTHDPVTSTQTKMHQQWADSIKEKTGGRVEITIYPGGSLSAATEALDAVKTGAADIGWIFTSFYPGQFPLTDVISLPLIGVSSPPQGTNVLWDLYADSDALRAELSKNNLKMLMMYGNPTSIIVTASKPVKTVDDVKGLKLRAPAGTATEMMKAWNGTPIMMGPGDVYQSLEKGVLDGYIFEYTGINSFKLQEVSKYYTEVFIYSGPFLIMMNQDSFNSLPADIQKIIEDESGRAMSIALAEPFYKDFLDVRAKILTDGKGEIIEIKGDALAAFEAPAKDYIKQWAEKNKSASFDSQAYINKAQELVEKYRQ